MMEVYEALKDDMYMWLTDCAFVNSNKKDLVISIFEKHKYQSKSYKSKFISIDKYKTEWIDLSKDVKKDISIANRHIENDYKLWKIVQEFNQKQL